jgi:hypothetical protein
VKVQDESKEESPGHDRESKVGKVVVGNMEQY